MQNGLRIPFPRPRAGDRAMKPTTSTPDLKLQSSMYALHQTRNINGGGLGTWPPYYSNALYNKKYVLPDATTPVDTEWLSNKTFVTRGRDQWDYNKVNDMVTSQSEFCKLGDRDQFDGPREMSHNDMEKVPYKQPRGGVKELYEYFEEYTDPKLGEKVGAAQAIQERWDSENWYYPGESWKRNRPAFRTVPKEILNKETWYTHIHTAREYEKIWTIHRPRSWNPRWPPPGFRLGKFLTKKDLFIGAAHPEEMHEWERWYWYKMWMVQNQRLGFGEALVYVLMFFYFYWFARIYTAYSWRQWNGAFTNSWYPGRRMFRPYGEPKNSEPTEMWWWQKPLDSTDVWKEPGLIWMLHQQRWIWFEHKARQQELEALGEASL